MKSLIKKLLRESLEEAIKSGHWVKDSYPTRIVQSTLKDMDPQYRVQIDKRVKDIENLEFSEENPQKIGVWLFKTPEEVHHEPYERRDKGNLLLAIVNNNNMTTLYWKHKPEGEYDYSITYEDLMKFSASKYYDGKNRPITIQLLRDWKKSTNPSVKPPETNQNKFKKLKLNNDTVVRYYPFLNKFETNEGQPINLDDIFDELPEELQNRVMELMESIEIPVEVGDTVLMGRFKNKKVIIKDIEWDEEKGDLTINGKPALKMRIIKQTEEDEK